MKLPIYKVLKISHKRYSNPTTLEYGWFAENMIVCNECKYCVDGICTNPYGMLGHGVDKEDYCSRGSDEGQ